VCGSGSACCVPDGVACSPGQSCCSLNRTCLAGFCEPSFGFDGGVDGGSDGGS
jgi:hypothetical protein